MLKLYIAVLDEFPDYMTPTLVAHAVLGAHLEFINDKDYLYWLENSFKKCIIRVNRKEFAKIAKLDKVYLAYEKNTLEAIYSCIVVSPREENPNVLKFAKLWSPKEVGSDGKRSVC